MIDTNIAGTNTYTGSFDTLKGIWGSCIFYNLFYIILLKFSNLIQALWIIFTGVLCVGYILTHHEKKTENRLLCGVLLINLWFLQNLCYNVVLPLYLDVHIGGATVVLGLYYSFTQHGYVLATAVLLSLLPSNIIKSLPIAHVELHILFFVVYWYLSEGYIYTMHRTKDYEIGRQIGLVIPIFVLPFNFMCPYYLFLSYWTYYNFYQEYKQNPIEEDIKVETPEIVIEEVVHAPIIEKPIEPVIEIQTEETAKPLPAKPVKPAKPKISLLSRIPTRVQTITTYNIPPLSQLVQVPLLESQVTPTPTFEVGAKLKNLYN